MQHTEEQVKELIEKATRELRRELDEVRDALTKQTQSRQVAEWAAIGVVRSDGRVRLEISPAQMESPHFAEVADHLAQRAARLLLHHAGLEFKNHALLYEAEHHIRGLEDMMIRNGISFISWDRLTTVSSTGRWPKEFKGPFGD